MTHASPSPNARTPKWFIGLGLVFLCGIGAITWRSKNALHANHIQGNTNDPAQTSTPIVTNDKPVAATPDANGFRPYQISTNFSALPQEKQSFFLHNFLPTANQFLQQFPTQHHPFTTNDIKAVSVNFGTNGYVWTLARMHSDDGEFQILTQTIAGTNHIQSYRDLKDFDVYEPGTLEEMQQLTSGSAPSSITTAAQARDFVATLLQSFQFDFTRYLNPPVSVPYVATSNYGLWEVRYRLKANHQDQEGITFVVDGTGATGPYLRMVVQANTWSLPSYPQQP